MIEKLVLPEENIISNGCFTETNNNPPTKKRKRNLPGTPDPEAEVIALSPKTLMATNRFTCEICGKGFQRDQNLQLHRRGHNLPWKLKQRTSKEVRKRVYVCPEKSCVHNHPSRALGDLTGIKKHFCRKHGEKKWKCAKCSKCYAVQSDWKAHSKTCGTREYKCDCGTIFSRRDSFITHRAFCDALAEETARVTAASHFNNLVTPSRNINYHFVGPPAFQPLSFKPVPENPLDTTTRQDGLSLWTNNDLMNQLEYQTNWGVFGDKDDSSDHQVNAPSLFSTLNNLHHPTATATATMSATALLQKAAQMGSTSSTTTATNNHNHSSSFQGNFSSNITSSTAVGNVQDDRAFCGLYTTSPMMNNSCYGGEDMENGFSSLNEMYPPSKTRRIHIEEGQTRDFLGVGIQPIGHPRIRFDHV
ncbi:hypothetical protein SSX86_032770 [Deinandra increscens subsp. villosa]|uniref:C2H2-type domain-containing protein n=1 Tax=Deinandra increscens subsp. villosa TaxID=3103831 RepID=A0AAP0GGY6_9ASTR